MSIRETNGDNVEKGSIWKIMRDQKPDMREESRHSHNSDFQVGIISSTVVRFGRVPEDNTWTYSHKAFFEEFIQVRPNTKLMVNLAAILAGVSSDPEYKIKIQEILMDLEI